MIAKLFGVLDAKLPGQVILNVGGVGYGVLCSQRTADKLTPDAPITLWIEHLFLQDSQILCGFLSPSEQACFRELLQVRGVGPRAALSVLSALDVSEIAAAVAAQDPIILTSANGIGRKVAERIVQELKSSKGLQLLGNSAGTASRSTQLAREVVDGLVSLGYDRLAATRAVQSLNVQAASDAAHLLKEALSVISQ